MAIKLDYVARETATNLTRNITLTVASVLTVVVSLTLFGSAVLLNQGVNNANDRFKGGIEFIIYLQPTSTQEQKDSIRRDLEANPDVKDDGITYVDQDETYDEFKRLFGDSPELVETVTPDILPPSFRIAPRVQDPDVVQALGDQFQAKPGVYEVVFAFEVVKRIQETFNKIGVRFLLAAVLLLVAALMLILNTIRVAMFARRREIEVMKLVGATDWFIRVPFMLEGLIQGVLGGVAAVGSMLFINWRWTQGVQEFPDSSGMTALVVTDGFQWTVAVIILAFGALVGMIGSGIAASRFLDV